MLTMHSYMDLACSGGYDNGPGLAASMLYNYVHWVLYTTDKHYWLGAFTVVIT